MIEHPKTWWYRLAERLVPGRCREIPEAQNPERIVLRQVAVVKRYLYLQQFAGSEDERYMHSHQWHRTFVLGLYGGYLEQRMAGPGRWRRAPYLYAMDASAIHHVLYPSAGHTSLFLGLWRDDNLKHYYGRPELCRAGFATSGLVPPPVTRRRLWSDHIKKMVARI